MPITRRFINPDMSESNKTAFIDARSSRTNINITQMPAYRSTDKAMDRTEESGLDPRE
jgi:hypothetical protein